MTIVSVTSLVLAPFQYAFVQRGLLEVVLLSVGAGLLGTWIVLRGLAFFSHAAGTAAFPGLVLADGLGFSAPLGAFAAALAFAFGVERLARSRRSGYDSLTALVLVGALALGVILASDVFHSGARVDSLLFGSLLLIGTRDLVLAALSSAIVLGASLLLGRRWLAIGFDAGSARALGIRSAVPDAILLVLIALGIVSALPAIGALLVTALFVVPAATVRLVTRRLRPWQVGSVALVAGEGVLGLWLSVEWNVPPGAAISVLAGDGLRTRRGGAARLPVRASARPGRRGAAAALGVRVRLASRRADFPVVATTTQIGDWARVVGGTNTRVRQILQRNTDPHEYEPRPADVEATAGAKLVLENGDDLDGWMRKVVSEAGGKPIVVDLGAVVPGRRPERSALVARPDQRDRRGRRDPRTRSRAPIPRTRRPTGGTPTPTSRRCRRSTGSIAVCFARVPRAQRKLVTDHDAFGYFAARYGIRVVGAVIPSRTTQAQPSAGETAKLIALIRREHVKAVFPESSINPKLAQAIARETGATSRYTLYGDTLGPAQTYLAMMRANADAMVRGFTGGRVGCP